MVSISAPPGLASLLRPFKRERFLSSHWPGKCLAIHGPPERLGGLCDVPELTDLASVLRAWRGEVMVNLPDRHEEHSRVRVGTTAARKLHDNGMVLTFPRAETQIPALRPWLAQLQLELGLPRSTACYCLLYANPTGETVSPHFDANANFIVQLRGTKGWRYAPNTWVEHPTERHAMNMRRPHAVLRQYVKTPAPARMPAGSKRVELRRGSVLFLARGWWHETVAREEALSLNFVFPQASWADVVGRAIVQRLHQHPRWRALADGVGLARDSRGPSARAQLAAMLRQLADDLGTLDATAVLAATEGWSCYEWTPGATFEIEGSMVTLRSTDGGEVETENEGELVPILGWFMGRDQPVRRSEFEDRFPSFAEGSLFEELVTHGLLRAVPA